MSGKSVKKSAKLAEECAEFLLLDDGFQHFALNRDVDIVVLDAMNPFGYGYLLPRGLLREPLYALKRADLIVIHRVNQITPFDLEKIKEKVRSITLKPIITTDLQFEGFVDQKGKKHKLVPPMKVACFCAIGNPDSFFALIKNLGLEIVESLVLQDHESIKEDALASFASKAQAMGCDALLCTEKDMARFENKNLEIALPLYAAEVSLQIVEGENIMSDNLLDWLKRSKLIKERLKLMRSNSL